MPPIAHQHCVQPQQIAQVTRPAALFACTSCWRKYATKLQLSRHKHAVHPTRQREPKVRPCSSPQRPSEVPSRKPFSKQGPSYQHLSSLQRHIRRCHKADVAVSSACKENQPQHVPEENVGAASTASAAPPPSHRGDPWRSQHCAYQPAALYQPPMIAPMQCQPIFLHMPLQMNHIGAMNSNSFYFPAFSASSLAQLH